MNNRRSPICVEFLSVRLRGWSILLFLFGVYGFIADGQFGISFYNVASSSLSAAEGDSSDGLILKSKGAGTFGGFGAGSIGSFRNKAQDPFRFTATYELDSSLTKGVISVTCVLDSGYYIYSTTQPRGGPMRTTLTVKSPGLELSQPFQSDLPPLVVEGERGFENVKVEKHGSEVTWRATFTSLKPLDPSKDEIFLSLTGQVCREGACIPIQNQSIIAFAGLSDRNSDVSNVDLNSETPSNGELSAAEGMIVEMPSDPPPLNLDTAREKSIQSLEDGSTNPTGTFKAPKSRVSWQIKLANGTVTPGTRSELVLTAITDSPFHLYEVRPTDKNIESSTTIAITQKSGLRMGTPIATEPPIRVELIPGELSISYHGQQISWIIPVEVSSDTADGIYSIEGKVGYQACTDKSCEDPMGLRFSGSLVVDRNHSIELMSDRESAFVIESIPFSVAAMDPTRLTWIDTNLRQPGDLNDVDSNRLALIEAKPISLSALFGYFALAMAGGLVLNLMPCVLPVIGLKIMSFVQESKQSNASVSILNLWYVAGILSVFLLLATITIIAREAFGTTFGWGSQFGYFGFRLATTILMFAMALSFLGVWEIPIPGFATSQQSSQLMHREGAIGAYFKGLLTTVLATPCSGPGLGAVFSLSIDQAPWIILTMYFAIGLGMSLPYILIALNPSLLVWMPKPGAWMQTLKEVLAFPLLLSVVWFLTTFSNDYRIAVMTCLIFVWLACWWIGKVPPWSESNKKILHWTGAVSVAVAGCFFAVQFLGPYKNLIDWQPYNESTLVSYRSQGKAVMIDFTAQWCANCKVNLATAIETENVAKLIRQQGIIPMIADHTELPDHITKKLEELRSTAIPVLAIYPGGLSNPPIVMRDLVTEQQVIAALRKATASREVRASRLEVPLQLDSKNGIQ